MNKRITTLTMAAIIILATCALAQTASRGGRGGRGGRAAGGPRSAPQPTEIRTYDIRPFLMTINQYPYRSDILPPTKLMSIDSLQDSGDTGRDDAKVSRREMVQNVIDMIVETIEPNSWVPHGDTGVIKELQGQLIVFNTLQAHKGITALLAQLSQARMQMATVEAKWVAIDPKDLKNVTSAGDKDTQGPAVIDTDKLAKTTTRTLYQGQMTSFLGQRVHIASGRGQSVTTHMTPVVADQAVAMAPVERLVHWGAILQATATRSYDTKTVVLDIDSVLSIPLADIEKGDRPSGTVTAGMDGAILGFTAADRLDFAVQKLQTTLAMPTDKWVVAGGMTLPKKESKAEGKSKANDEVVYLVVKVSVSK